MGLFNRTATAATETLNSKSAASKKLMGINGLTAGAIATLPGMFIGTEIGEIADDINDMYYKGKPNPYNSSYNATGFAIGGLTGFGIGRHYGRKATKMLLDNIWSPKSELGKKIILT